ncbi:hypothetical protein [Pedobacter aquatilis]|uniref:hypothetical protein n=1 Tax=Pedobacter aquatilis TaxID=351343 RepID=UPI002931225F|nr:hypothetical protein [Pedobacter aquatilis]
MKFSYLETNASYHFGNSSPAIAPSPHSYLSCGLSALSDLKTKGIQFLANFTFPIIHF